jgi:uncharacterized protein
MPPPNTDTRLIVFAKAPQPGAVKTRLMPLLGEAGAAALHGRLVEHTLATARRADIGPVELCCAPADDPFFDYCRGQYGVSLAAQAEGDLGARMQHTFVRALSAARHAVLVGTDCPALTVSHLRQAAHALAGGNDAALVPAEDGGYALLGLNRCNVELFHDIEWGSANVMAATRERLRRLRWRWKELETLWDIDRPEDYRRLLTSGLLDTGERASAD